MYGATELELHAFLPSALDGSEWSASLLGNQSGCGGKEKMFLSLLGIKPQPSIL